MRQSSVAYYSSLTRGYLSGMIHGGTRRTGIRVFVYHGIVVKKADPLLENIFNTIVSFQSHLSFLRKFRILSFDELSDELSHERIDKPAAVITFDDGYSNTLLAAELLSKARFPWFVFIPTGAVDGGRPIWTTELSLLLLHGQAEHVDILDKIWNLGTRSDREVALQVIKNAMKSMPSIQHSVMMDNIRCQFGKGELERLEYQFPSMRMLSWKDIIQLSNADVEVGSHGVDHEIHHSHQPEEIRRRELEQSKIEIEGKTGRLCRSFAFPNGDICDQSQQEVKDAGYQMAFTTRPGTVSSESERLLLPRMPAYSMLHTFIRNFYWAL